MDAKEAIGKAKLWVSEIFDDEKISDLGLEEVKYDLSASEWLITLGFSRPWNSSRNLVQVIQGGSTMRERTYKVVRVKDPSGDVVAVENRFVGAGQ